MLWLFLLALSTGVAADAKSPFALPAAPNCAIPMHGKANADPACTPARTDEERLKKGATAKEAPYSPEQAQRLKAGQGGRCKTTSECPTGFFCSPSGDCTNRVIPAP